MPAVWDVSTLQEARQAHPHGLEVLQHLADALANEVIERLDMRPDDVPVALGHVRALHLAASQAAAAGLGSHGVMWA